MNFGTTFKGTYQLVPPPSVGFIKKIKRGVKKAAKKTGKVAKKAGKVAVKVNVAPIKAVAKAGKFALRASAKLAALPVIAVVNKLAGRRARYLAFKRSGTTKTTTADKRAGGQYALDKLRKAGPLGKFAVKVLKFTGGVTAGQLKRSMKVDAAICGVAPAAIAAAAASIVSSVTALMKALNKPGEAPANPAAAQSDAEPTQDVQPVIESEETPQEEQESADESSDGATEGVVSDYDRAYFGRLRERLATRQ